MEEGPLVLQRPPFLFISLPVYFTRVGILLLDGKKAGFHAVLRFL